MHNIKLTLAYDGTDFCGWQVQPGQPTIQGVLNAILSQITAEAISVRGAGRTDAGVHAWGQVVNFMTHSKIPPRKFEHALNALLPPSIRVREAAEVGPDFDARWSACAKTYAFRIYRGEVVPPQMWRYVWHYPYALDFAGMAEAARCLEGQHDFTSFAASSGFQEIDQQRTTLRSIYRSELMSSAGDMPLDLLAASPRNEAIRILDQPDHSAEWIYLVRGPSFLRHMVRKIMGTLLEVGRGRLTPQDIPRLLAQRDRACSGPTAPPQGLCLLSVEYPGPAEPSPPPPRALDAGSSL